MDWYLQLREHMQSYLSSSRKKVERPSSARSMCSQLVLVGYAISATRKDILSANLEEIGERSAVILTESYIRRGTKLCVHCGNHELKGVVEACSADKQLGFFVRMRMLPGYQWSEKWFTPEHLFTLCPSLQALAG